MIGLGKIRSKIKSEWKEASKAEKIFFGYCLVGPLGFYLFPIYLGIRKLLRRCHSNVTVENPKKGGD